MENIYLASVFAPFSVKFSLRKRTVLWVDEIDALTLETQIQSHTSVLGLVQVVSIHGERERDVFKKKKLQESPGSREIEICGACWNLRARPT